MWKRTIRWSIAWSSQLLPRWFFSIGYVIAIWLAVRVLGSFKSVLAIYLCSGCAKNDITPGISDIDLQIIIANDSQEKPDIERAFATLGKLTLGVIDYYPSLIYTIETLEHRWQTAPAWQYRYKEAASSWRLLHGNDVMRSLPPLSEAQRRTSCYVEMNRWWLLFSERLIKSSGCADDIVLRNVICFKAVAELLKLERELASGICLSRKEALAASDLELARKLLTCADKKFLVADDGLMDETLEFLVNFFSSLWSRFPEAPFLQVQPGVVQQVDCNLEDLELSPEMRQQLRRLSLHLQKNWDDICTGTHVVKSAFFDFDAVAFIVDVKNVSGSASLPSREQLAELARLHKLGPLADQIYIFLRTEPALAFPLTPVMPADLHRGILTPATVPDVFIQLGVEPVYWTDYTQWYLCQWSTNERWSGPCAQKKFQLNTISQSARRLEVFYPLTIRALNRETRRARNWHSAREITTERNVDVLQTR